MEISFESITSDPLHHHMIEGLLVVEGKGVAFTYCSHQVKYWSLRDLRKNLKNLSDRSSHLNREDGQVVPRGAYLKHRTLAEEPIPPITNIQFCEKSNILLVGFRDTYVAVVKVYLGSVRGKYRKRRGLTFKSLKFIKTAQELGYANISLHKNILMLGELNERFSLVDLRTGLVVLNSAEEMEDWVTGLTACLDNRYFVFSSIFGSLAIYEQLDAGSRLHKPTFSKAWFFKRFNPFQHKLAGGIHCLSSTNLKDDPLLFLGGRKEARFADVSMLVVDVITCVVLFEFKDELSKGLFTSVCPARPDKDCYVLYAKNQDHQPGQQSVLLLQFRYFEAAEEPNQRVHSVQSKRFPTNGCGGKSNSLYGQVLTEGSSRYFEGFNSGRCKTVNYFRSLI